MTDVAGEDRQLRAAAARSRAASAELALQFDLVVLDEVAADQEPHQHDQPGRALDLAARRSWALTGTPVENSADDLVGIFEFLAPGYLSRRDEAAAAWAARSRDYVLRRTKDKVLTDLPPKLFRDADARADARAARDLRAGRRTKACCG